MTSRLPRGRVARLRQELGDRELAVLRSLSAVRLLSLKQLQRLHVVDGSVHARVRRAQALLKRLHSLGLVVRLSRVIGGVRAGSAGFIYGLSALGQAVLDHGGPLGGRPRRVWEARPYFQDHMLAGAELYVRLVEGDRAKQFELLAYAGEPACWRYCSGPGGEPIIVKPDAYVRLGLGDFERHVFVEVDLATEGLATIQRKSLRYVAYWQSGSEQQRHGVFPKVVWLVPDERRRVNIAGALGKLALQEQRLFDVGLLSDGPEVLSRTTSNTTSEVSPWAA